MRHRRPRKVHARGREKGHLAYDAEAMRQTHGTLVTAASALEVTLPRQLLRNLAADIVRGYRLRKSKKVSNAVDTGEYALALFCSSTKQAHVVQTTLDDGLCRVDVRLFDGDPQDELRRIAASARAAGIPTSSRHSDGRAFSMTWSAVAKLPRNQQLTVQTFAPTLAGYQLTFTRVARRTLQPLRELLRKAFEDRLNGATIGDVHDMG